MFYVFGDYGYTSQCELYRHKNREFAERWAKGYTRNGDLGGYSVIEVAYLLHTGEYRTVWTLYAEELAY